MDAVSALCGSFPFLFLDVTEQAALASFKWLGRGDKYAADNAATEAMRRALNTLPIRGRVVIGEGEMDEAPMLYIGEKVGLSGARDPEVDLALDPLDGTKAAAKGMDRALCVLAGSGKGGVLHAPDTYMEKLVVRPGVPPGTIDLDRSLRANVLALARALGKDARDVGVCLLDRPRHQESLDCLRTLGVRVLLIPDGDVSGALYTVLPDSGVDMYVGVGGAPEGVIAAAGVFCMGGFMQARLLPRNAEEAERVRSMGLKDASRKLGLHDLVPACLSGETVFFLATGVTNDKLLPGVSCEGGQTTTHTLVLSSLEAGVMSCVRRRRFRSL